MLEKRGAYPHGDFQSLIKIHFLEYELTFDEFFI
jgi:hypothetical protein